MEKEDRTITLTNHTANIWIRYDFTCLEIFSHMVKSMWHYQG